MQDRKKTTLGRALFPHYDTGASFPKRLAWYFVNLGVLYNPWMPLSLPRVWALRLFGAKIGRGVHIKPQVKVKFPWKLQIDDGGGLGEECWVDNLDRVRIGKGAMLSQRAYLCTGNHDWSSHDMDLVTQPIEIGDHVWIAANVTVGPGSRVGDNAVVTAGSVVQGEIPAGSICSGPIASPVKRRKLKKKAR